MCWRLSPRSAPAAQARMARCDGRSTWVGWRRYGRPKAATCGVAGIQGAGTCTPDWAQSARSRVKATGAMPVCPMSLTAVRASAARRGSVTWSAMCRRAGISGIPPLRVTSASSHSHAWSPVSLTGADAVTWSCACSAGAPPQPAAINAGATAVNRSALIESSAREGPARSPAPRLRLQAIRRRRCGRPGSRSGQPRPCAHYGPPRHDR